MVAPRLLRWLRQPYPISSSRRSFWRSSLFGGLFVTLFLFFFRPFGSRCSRQSALVVAHLCRIRRGYLADFPDLGQPDPGFARYFSGRKVAGLEGDRGHVGLRRVDRAGQHVLHRSAIPQPVFLVQVLVVVADHLGCGYFCGPVLGILLKQMRLMRRYSTEASALSAMMEPPSVEPTSSPAKPIILYGDNQGESLVLAAH